MPPAPDPRIIFPPPAPTSAATPHYRLDSSVQFAISSLAPALAVVLTNPFDTAKVRLQLQGERHRQLPPGSAPPHIYKNSFDCIIKTFRVEGIRGLQKGLAPAVLRESSKNLFRLGLYAPILDILHPPASSQRAASERAGAARMPPTWKLFFAGSLSGAVGALACNPFELVKTRLQASAAGDLARVGTQHQYRGTLHALHQIVIAEGPRGLLLGSPISILRSIFGSGANLAAYNVSRDFLTRKRLLVDNRLIDIASGLSSGLASVLLMNPVDVLRTRYYNQPEATFEGGVRRQQYANAGAVLVQLVREEGLSALYKGFVSHFLRIGPHFALTFFILGALRRTIGGAVDSRDAAALFDAYDDDKDGVLTRDQVLQLSARALSDSRVYPPDIPASVTAPAEAQAAAAPAVTFETLRRSEIHELERQLREAVRNITYNQAYILLTKTHPNTKENAFRAWATAEFANDEPTSISLRGLTRRYIETQSQSKCAPSPTIEEK